MRTSKDPVAVLLEVYIEANRLLLLGLLALYQYIAKGWQLEMKNLLVKQGRRLPSWRTDTNKAFKIGKFAGTCFVHYVGVILVLTQRDVS